MTRATKLGAVDLHPAQSVSKRMPEFVAPEVQSRMRKVRREDTAPEMAVRRAIHAAGLRYSLHRSDLPGKPDIVLAGRKAVVFVHGCFWHGHSCRAGRRPSTNSDYWSAKIDRNVERDARCIEELKRLGWRVWVIWSCDLGSKVSTLIDDLVQLRPET